MVAGLLCLLFINGWAEAFDSSFWVWQRRRPLSLQEQEQLGGISSLYWHAGEISNSGSSWHWTARFPLPPATSALKFIPVIRLTTEARQPFGEESDAQLCQLLSGEKFPQAQIDMDCPDRLLGDYAALLAKIHRVIPRLSVTALAGWSQNRQWEQFQEAVDEIVPMFYDLQPDISGANPLPLLDPRPRQFAAWGKCKIPWKAGLPSFARASLYGADNRLKGHLRQWSWEEICFNPALSTQGQSLRGVTVLRADSPALIAQTPVAPGDYLIARWPDLSDLARAIESAKAAGAAGVVFFKLPEPEEPTSWSAKQLGQLSAKAVISVSWSAETHRLVLANDSQGDLPPRLSGTLGPRDRGYELEVDAPAPVFRDALEGDFWRLASHADPDLNPRPVPILLATRLTFWFSHLYAGTSLASGLIQFAPDTNLSKVRYRILPIDPQWKPIK